MSPDDPITAASARVHQRSRELEAERDAFFDLCAERVREGLDTADTIAARSFPTAVTIRKELRLRGVEPLPRGPKRAQPAGE